MPIPGFTGTFDASQFAPKQAGTTHPVGNKFPSTITNTSIEPIKSGEGGMFIVEHTTPAGVIVMRYNLWHNTSPQTVQIAQGQLSALCHATGVFKLDWENDGAALRNARCKIDVVDQIDKKTNLPNGYTQISKVYDANGNEPGKPPQQPTVQPQQGQGAPLQTWQQPAAQAGGPANPAWGNAGPGGAGQAQQPSNPAWSQGPTVQSSQGPGNAPPPPWAQK